MAKLEFKDLKFRDLEKENCIEVIFLRQYSFNLDKKDLGRIGKFVINKDLCEESIKESNRTIEFPEEPQETAERKFYSLLYKGFLNLKNKFNKKPATYIHRNSGIPLIGHVSFGIIDRGTNVIEIKPQTGCNIKCIYCSVNEDIRPHDFVIEKDYLVEESIKVIEQKKGLVDLHIGSSSEVFMYEPIYELLEELAAHHQVNKIAISTNGMYLTEKIIDKLGEITQGKIRLNISLNAITKEKASLIAGVPYPVERVKKICAYIQKNPKVELIIAPVWMNRINDDELELLVKFSKEIGATLMVQNFLNYKRGRNPVKEVEFETFAEKLQPLEKKYDITLLHSELPETYKKSTSLPRPFRKNQVIEAEFVGPGRFPGEKIAAAQNRIISFYGEIPGKKSIRLRITRAKNNMFVGEAV